MLFVLLLTSTLAAADGGFGTASNAKEGFQIVHADQLDQWLKAGKPPVHLYDANHDEFRKENGIINGAVLLAGSDWDLAKTLPADKSARLVFYCSNKL